MNVSLRKTPEEQTTNFATVRDYVTTITILESLNDAIFILNPAGRIEYANRSALDLLGSSLVDIVSHPIEQFLICESGIEPDMITDHEAMLVNGSVKVPVSLSFNGISGAETNGGYIVVTAKDISSRQFLEDELREQQAISVSRDRLRALGELSVGLVHELSQPLAAMKLKIEFMRAVMKREGNLDNGQDKGLGELSELVDRMANTINNTRNFANQTEETSQSIVKVNSCVENACSLVAYELRKRAVTLTTDLENELPFIIANGLSIEQVLVNLLTNARDAFDNQKASDDKKPERSIHITTSSIDDKWLEIRISDNAGGIDADTIPKIFHPFFTTRGKESNSGVGLYIARRIVNSIGGDIHVRVRPGEGSEFMIRLPVTQDEEGAQLYNLIEMFNQN